MPVFKEKIRPLAVVIIRKGNKVLLSPGYDTKIDKNFYRLPGGGVEFGETSLETLKREIQEELGADLENIKLLKIVENIFTYNGDPGHEISFIYEAEFSDKALYNMERFKILDSDKEHFAIWEEINEDNAAVVYPEGAGLLILNK